MYLIFRFLSFFYFSIPIIHNFLVFNILFPLLIIRNPTFLICQMGKPKLCMHNLPIPSEPQIIHAEFLFFQCSLFILFF